jgi:hypothetical protein
MADSDSAPWRQHAAPQAVANSAGATTFDVQVGAWASVAPHLPAEFAAMLAPPIVVTSAPVGADAGVPTPTAGRRRAELMRYRMNMPAAPPGPPYGRHRRSRAH